MIAKKEYPSPLRDYIKPVVLFYDLMNMGYDLTMNDIRKAIKLTNSQFSEDMINETGYFAEAINFLKLGLDDDSCIEYGITIKELEVNNK
ncbi:hypothetical protein [Candidatus Nitrosocosmicus arcticus]|uniref:Uncharacterized protein n=1 Tax=Candidatus Nitrosocosmicus arcticus TaxID=2035267 RepID=A0A557STF4_9ARCH|nr:hypothetical protein [Candidatus Nitrosocosmicus arcticus]TVP39865.1 hypothetical protein NARC_110077 [Candidatus Nitrosocosmicus arcticus]